MSLIDRIKSLIPAKSGIPGAVSKKKDNKNYKFIATGIIFYLLIVILISVDFTSLPDMPRINEVATFDIKSPVALEVIDKTQTELMKIEAEKSIKPIYKFHEEIYNSIQKSAENICRLIGELNKKSGEISLSLVEKEMTEIKGMKISNNNIKKLSEIILKLHNISDREIEKFRVFLSKLIEDTLSLKRERLPGLDYPGVKVEDIEEIVNISYKKIRESDFSDDFKKLAGKIFYTLAKATYLLDKKSMEEKKKEIRKRIRPIKRVIAKGEIIIRNGEIVKEKHIEIFKKLSSIEKGKRPWIRFLGSLIISLVTLFMIMFYLYQFKKEAFFSSRIFNLLALIILFILFIAKIGRFLILSDAKITIFHTTILLFSPFIVPFVSATMLIALLIDSSLAIFVNMVLAILVQIILHLKGITFFISLLISGSLSVLILKKINQRSDLVKVGTLIGISNVLVVLSLYFMNGNVFNINYRSLLVRDLSWAFINGIFSTIIALGCLPFLESLFKISTSMRLLELSDLNQPLMRRLLLEAQGTYHHSIVVGTLAEAAAKEIGCNALLCRVGAYYHDIGKLKRPNFFVENQSGNDNIHDNIKPNLSALVIMSHCKEGKEIGIQYNLPVEILDIIEQHHGTNLLTYFYFKAQNEGDSKEDFGKQETFRYPGPKPQSREAAIVFLADSVEAATRSLSKPTPSSIKGMIKKIINERFNDEQFSECDLTLKDMEMINYTFAKTILGMFHSRIEYPGDDK